MTSLSAVLIFNAGVEKASALATNQQKEPSQSHARGELIVKYNDSVEGCMHCILAMNQSADAHTASQPMQALDQSASLDRLHRRYRVQKARHVFLTGKEIQATHTPNKGIVPIAEIRKHTRRHAQEIEARFHRRSFRAQGVVSPESAAAENAQVYVVSLATTADIEKAAQEFAANPHIEYAQPNYLAVPYYEPNDPFFYSSGSFGQSYPDLWGLKETGINVQPAWNQSRGRGAVVAVIDTGIDYQHPDLTANIWRNPGEIPYNGMDDDGNGYVDDFRGWNFSDCDEYLFIFCAAPRDPNNNPMDRAGHGTHVAGTIAAVGNNGLGIIGVAPEAKIMPLKAMNDNGQMTMEKAVEAMRYAVNNGADIINNSWGCASPCPSNPVLEEAVISAQAQGVSVVFAAGNSANNVSQYSPQNMTTNKPVVVGAFTETAQRASFSNYGETIDIYAPGGSSEDIYNIVSLKSSTCTLCGENGPTGHGYARFSGTSMAAPHASGVLALLLAESPDLAPQAAREKLRQNARPGNQNMRLLDAPAALNLTGSQINRAPQAQIEIAYQSGRRVVLDATASKDPDGDSIIEYRWRFGDGQQLTTSQSVVNHLYPGTGNFTARVQAVDENGAVSAAAQISITVKQNEAPQARIFVFPSTGYAPLTAFFIGSGFDPDGDPLSYSWQFADGGYGFGRITLRTFPQPGVFPVTLTVRDSAGNSGRSTIEIVVREPLSFSSFSFSNYFKSFGGWGDILK